MKCLSTLLMVCLSLSFIHGIKNHPSLLNSSGQWVVWSEKPVTSWQDAFVTGSESHGTMVMGQPGEERIICVHEESFMRGWDRNKMAIPCTASSPPQVRSLMESEKSDVADTLMTSEVDRQSATMGTRRRWPLIPHPAFDLCIRHTGTPLQTEKQYRKQLDLKTGEVLTFWCESGKVTESVFSSREYSVNVARLKADEGNKMDLVLNLKGTPGCEDMHFDYNLDNVFSSMKAEAASGWLFYRAGYKYDIGDHEGLAHVTVKGGNMTAGGDSLWIADAEEVLVPIRTVPLKGARLSARSFVQKELSGLPLGYGKLLKPHSQMHREMLRHMQLDLGCSFDWKTVPTEKMLSTIHECGVIPLFLE